MIIKFFKFTLKKLTRRNSTQLSQSTLNHQPFHRVEDPSNPNRQSKPSNSNTPFINISLIILVILNLILIIYISCFLPYNQIHNILNPKDQNRQNQSLNAEIKAIVQESICFNHAEHLIHQVENTSLPLLQFDLCSECHRINNEFNQFCLFQSLIKRIPKFHHTQFPNGWFKKLNTCTYEQLQCDESNQLTEVTLIYPVIPTELPLDSLKNFTFLNSISLIGNISGELPQLPDLIHSLYLKDTQMVINLSHLTRYPISYITLINNTMINDIHKWFEIKLNPNTTHFSFNQPSLVITESHLKSFLLNNEHIKRTLVELNFKSADISGINTHFDLNKLLDLNNMGYNKLNIYIN